MLREEIERLRDLIVTEFNEYQFSENPDWLIIKDYQSLMNLADNMIFVEQVIVKHRKSKHERQWNQNLGGS